MLDSGYRYSLPGDQGRQTGIGNHVVTGRNGDAFVNESDAEFASWKKFKGNGLAGMQADTGDFKDAVDGCLALDH